MKSKTFVNGTIVKKYEIPLEQIKELNDTFDKQREKLLSESSRLAGRINTELSASTFIQNIKIYNTIKNCINEFILASNHFGLVDAPVMDLHISSVWINDMLEGEYNPPHTHFNPHSGWSTVLFLKVPEIINDAKHKHKFRDGQLCFTWKEGHGSFYVTPKVGDFYIFRADHQHSVMPFRTKKKGDVRRSMSFNFEKKTEENNARQENKLYCE